MHIVRTEIKGFGKLKDRTVSFGSGVNLIYGYNEAGKSTLQWFIKAMLYGLKGGRQSAVGLPSPLKRFVPWDGANYGGAMVYTLDDGSSFRAERDFEKNNVYLYDNSYNDITGAFVSGRDKLPMFAQAQLGMDEATFERTVFIRQMEVRLGSDGMSALAAKLASVSKTGIEGMSFERAEAALADALRNRIGTDRTRTQPLDRLETELKRLEDEHTRLIDRHKQRQSLREDLASVKDKLSGLDEQERYLTEAGKLIEIRKKLDAGIKKEAALKEAAGQLSEIEQRFAQMQKEAGPKESADGRGAGSIPGGGSGKIKYKSSKVGTTASVLCFAVALTSGTLFVYELAGHGLSSIPFLSYIYLLVMLISAVVGVRTLRKGMKGQDLAAVDRPGDTSDSSDAAAKEANTAEELEKRSGLEVMQRNTLNSASLIYGKRIDDIQNVRKALKEVQAGLDDLSRSLQYGLDTMEDPPRDYDGYFSSRELDVLIYDMDIASLEAAWKTDMDNVRQELLKTALSERYCEGQLDDEKEDSDELQRVEEETFAVKEKIEYLKNMAKAIRLAHEVLMEAGTEIRENYAPDLNARMGRIITELTDNRYTDLRGDGDLTLKASDPDSGDVRKVPVLSGGTADQMYLALRLSMAGLLTLGSESLPLIMDEVFAQFDDNRTALALKYLHNEYRDSQILIFTCKRREIELAQEIFGDSMNFVEL